MFDAGFSKLFKVRGIPVRVHWSILLGFLYVGGVRFAPGAWLGYFTIVLVHELGHAVLAQGFGARVHTIDVHGLGGYCVHDAVASPIQASVIAWGGVLGQLLLFVAALVLGFVSPVSNPHALDFMAVLGATNLLIIAFNLLPVGALDGAKAWKLPGLLLRARRRKQRRRRASSTKQRSSGPAAGLRLVRDKNGDFRFEHDDDSKH